ncbi:hypothetical protein ACFOW1_15550 [Parasediminibacterium paludis]|uniref:Uncharacterized protein n=1 Tax=Parasediminibacterium paludis TaxID=908966 RepID=A0ABV8Q0W2_9BACT
MFTNISWTTYLTFVALFLSAWYIIICLRFYSSDILNFISSKTKTQKTDSGNELQATQYAGTKTAALEENINNAASLNEAQTDHLFEDVETLSAKIKEAVSDASSKDYNKEEFFFLLEITLKAYPQLKGIPFQTAINNLIISECDKHGFIHPSSEELDRLWIGI